MWPSRLLVSLNALKVPHHCAHVPHCAAQPPGPTWGHGWRNGWRPEKTWAGRGEGRAGTPDLHRGEGAVRPCLRVDSKRGQLNGPGNFGVHRRARVRSTQRLSWCLHSVSPGKDTGPHSLTLTEGVGQTLHPAATVMSWPHLGSRPRPCSPISRVPVPQMSWLGAAGPSEDARACRGTATSKLGGPRHGGGWRLETSLGVGRFWTGTVPHHLVQSFASHGDWKMQPGRTSAEVSDVSSLYDQLYGVCVNVSVYTNPPPPHSAYSDVFAPGDGRICPRSLSGLPVCVSVLFLLTLPSCWVPASLQPSGVTSAPLGQALL